MKKIKSITEAATIDQPTETPLCLKVAGAIGCPGLERFAPSAKNPAELSRLLGFNRSTISDWICAGSPREPDGTFSIPKVVAWRNNRNPSSKPTEPRDDLLRGFCRVLRLEAYLATMNAAEELACASGPANDADLHQLQRKIAMILARHFGPVCPSESEVEKLLIGPVAR